jgi:hypothetical protein
MYCVFALNLEGKAGAFEHSELKDALDMCETLRKAGCYRYVTMAVEDPNHVGKMGVAEAGPDYEWMKRRDAIGVRQKEMKGG